MPDIVSTIPYGPRFDEALLYASELHRDQFRKGTSIPYITHLLAVATLVGEHGGTEDEVIAGLLHDAVEDGHGLDTLGEITSRFGQSVADIVLACSDSSDAHKDPERQKATWRARREQYITHIDESSPSALLVSVSDKVHNVRSIQRDLILYGDALWDRFNAGRDDQLWYYQALADAFQERLQTLDLEETPLGVLVHELRHVVGEMSVASYA